ncbi:MAG: HEAT repeat domain-containing protein [Elusimicrobia bacterium]|nr:HEAT repeat domain-containing protein [Elusimicrobiota bacterium]
MAAVWLVLWAAALRAAAAPTPVPIGSGCQIMPEKCPAGWVERNPGRSSGDSWVDCCPLPGPFPELPPQKPERIPVCPGSSHDPNEWVAFGIAGEGGCDLGDPNCPIQVPEADGPRQAAPADEPRKLFPLADLPEPGPGQPAARTKLIPNQGRDPGEDSAAVAGMRAGLKSRSAPERARSALLLARAGKSAVSAAASLEQVLKRDPDPKVRACAALALSIVVPDRAVASLGGALADRHTGVRYAAVEALSRIGTPEARQVLQDFHPVRR